MTNPLRLAAALLIAGLTTPTSAATIRFKPAAVVQSAIVTLGDIADVVDTDSERVKRLASIQLVPAPVPEQTLRLEFGIVRSRLQAHGINLADLEFAGRSVVEVRRAAAAPEDSAAESAPRPADTAQQRAGRLIIAAIREHCCRQAPELGSVDIEVEVRPDDAARLLSAGATRLMVAEASPPSAGSQSMLLRSVDRAGMSREIKVTAEIASRPWVLAAKDGVPSGHRLQLADLGWMQVKSVEGLCTGAEQLLGQETTRAIRPGEPLRTADLRSVPLVRSGEIITVSCRRGGVSVRRQMQARADGARGEEIMVVTPEGRERLSARVTGPGEAEVGYKPASITTIPSLSPPGDGLRVVSEPEP